MDDPIKQTSELIRAARDAAKLYSSTKSMLAQITQSSAFLATHRSGFSEVARVLQRQRELFDPMLGVQRLLAEMRTAQQFSDGLAKDYLASIGSIHEQSEKWRSMIAPAISQLDRIRLMSQSIPNLSESMAIWASTTSQSVNRFSNLGMVLRNEALAQRLLAPNDAFADFARHTIVKIGKSTDSQQSRALELSLHLAEEQLITTTDALSTFAALPDDADTISAQPQLLSPYVQQEELLTAANNNEDDGDEELIARCSVPNVVDQCRCVLMNIAACNASRKVAGKEEIFKPTTRLLEVYADMPWLLPTSRHTFALFVDYLYFIFYEGAGKDKLRFLETHGGPIADDEFEFILCIKHIRNKWTRHDADHGDESAIRKSWSELSAKFKWLGLAHMPVTDEDFRFLHVSLLSQANLFAKKILMGVINHNSES